MGISHAEPDDVHALADLMEELDRFYGVTRFDPVEDREEQIRQALFGARPAGYVLLARDGLEPVGMAAYSFIWPAAGVTTSLFLKELYVRRARQREGIGRRLVQAVCDIAVAEGCSRVEWQTDQENIAAQGFYKSLGVAAYPGKVFYRLGGADLAAMAGAYAG
jgi:GNAT superfamily N-acetyltransferase